jgi:hypothetical protein
LREGGRAANENRSAATELFKINTRMFVFSAELNTLSGGHSTQTFYSKWKNMKSSSKLQTSAAHFNVAQCDFITFSIQAKSDTSYSPD